MRLYMFEEKKHLKPTCMTSKLNKFCLQGFFFLFEPNCGVISFQSQTYSFEVAQEHIETLQRK